MSLWKMPPKAKVYEALSAIADERVRVVGPNSAEVGSSSGDKIYSVAWSEDMSAISSNDNASYWQGYLGYPVLAVLLMTGRVAYRPKVAERLAGIPWKKLNLQFKRDYDAAVQHALEGIAAVGGDVDTIKGEVESIYAQLSQLKLDRGPQRKPPPK